VAALLRKLRESGKDPVAQPDIVKAAEREGMTAQAFVELYSGAKIRDPQSRQQQSSCSDTESPTPAKVRIRNYKIFSQSKFH